MFLWGLTDLLQDKPEIGMQKKNQCDPVSQVPDDFFPPSAEDFIYQKFGSFTKASKEHNSLRREVLQVLHDT